MVCLLQHLVGPEAQDTKAVRLQPGRTPVVLLGLVGVLAAVDLDHQTDLQASEIRYVGPQRNLAPEPVARELVGAQAPPELFLRVCLLPPKASCTLACHILSPSPQPSPARGEGEMQELYESGRIAR